MNVVDASELIEVGVLVAIAITVCTRDAIATLARPVSFVIDSTLIAYHL